jgi:hypothetical protein
MKSKFLIEMIFIAGAVLLQAWLFMLGIHFAHSMWWESIPTIGYGASVVVVTLIRASMTRWDVSPNKS